MSNVVSISVVKHSAANPCPVCGGHPRGRPRCAGRREGSAIWCASVFLANGLTSDDDGLFLHAETSCPCTHPHDVAPLRPVAPSSPPSSPAPAKLALRTAVDIAKPRGPIDFIIPRLGLMLGPGAPHMMAGYPSSGKTLVLQACVLSLLRGLPVWTSLKATKKIRRVLHLDYEMGETLVDTRYQRLARAMGFEASELGDSLQTASYPDLRLEPQFYSAWREIMTGLDLIILDSFRVAAGGIDENSSREVTPVLEMLARLSQETKCRPWLVHHLNKPPMGAPSGDESLRRSLQSLIYRLRGSTAIIAGIDGGWGLIGTEGEPVYAGQFRARTTGSKCDDFVLVFRDVPKDKDPKWGLRVEIHTVGLLQEQRAKSAAARQAQLDEQYRERIRAVLLLYPEGRSKKDVQLLARLDWEDFCRTLLSMGGEVAEEPGPKTGRRGQRGLVLRALPQLASRAPVSDPAP